MPKTVPVAISRRPSGRFIARVFVMASPTPRATNSAASVTTNGTMRNLVTSRADDGSPEGADGGAWPTTASGIGNPSTDRTSLPEDRRSEVHHRADRQVDSRRQHDERHSDRDDGERRGLHEDLQEHSRIAKAIGGDRQPQVDQHEEDDSGVPEERSEPTADPPLLARIVHDPAPPPSAARISSSRSKRSRVRTSAISPSRMTRIRSHSPMSSSSSEEIRRTPEP